MAVFTNIIDQYEKMEDIHSDDGCRTIAASFTPNNGITIRLEEREDAEVGQPPAWDDWIEFHLDEEDAIALGEALIRWGKTGHFPNRN